MARSSVKSALPTPGPREGRPFIFLNAAVSADGKLAPSDRRFSPFTSPWDQRRLYLLRTCADAVLSGARTVQSGIVTMGSGGVMFEKARASGRRPVLLKVIASGRARLHPDLPVFEGGSGQAVLLTTSSAHSRDVARLRPVLSDIHVSPPDGIDWVSAMKWLFEVHGVRSLVCEGGGEVNAGMIRAGLVDELYVTLAPVLFGGRSAPTLADGTSPDLFSMAKSFRLVRAVRRGGEMFLRYAAVR